MCRPPKHLKYTMKNYFDFSKLWEQQDSNLWPPACKAGALNQLSYAPIIFKNSRRCRRFSFAVAKVDIIF